MRRHSTNETDLLTGKTALATGATAGIGFYTARELARLGAVVSVTGRDESRGRDAERRLRASAGHDGVHFTNADAATVGSNQRLASRVLTDTDPLHILVNNVGGHDNDRWETADGYEATLSMNLVGPFALTEALRPALRAGAPARIVTVTSSAHDMWEGDPFEDVHAETSYLGFDAYARANLLALCWTFALARRLGGESVVANATNPGRAWTAMPRNLAPRSMSVWQRPYWPLIRVVQRTGSPETAARSSIALASAPGLADVTGTYFESDAREERPAELALDRIAQERTWELARTLVSNAPTAVSGIEASVEEASR